MRLGVLLPTFRDDASDALDRARHASELGLDGVFAYDHLWPMGQPSRPALAPFPILAAVARRHADLVVGPLVARVGLVGTSHLVEQFRTLAALAPGRVIATLGSGDRLSADENRAYGLSELGAHERRALIAETRVILPKGLPPMAVGLFGYLGYDMVRLSEKLPYAPPDTLGDEMLVWIGAGAAATNAIASELGLTINLWDATPERVREVGASTPVTWAGPEPDDLFATLDALAHAGSGWAVLAPQVDPASLAKWRDERGKSTVH